MTNTIAFHVADADGALLVEPVIDGAALSEIVRAYERKSGYRDPSGGYGGLPSFAFGSMAEHFRGRSSWPSNDGTHCLLVCACSESGCWSFRGRVQVGEAEVCWTDFTNPHRPERDYAGLGPWVFERSDYEEALAKLPTGS